MSEVYYAPGKRSDSNRETTRKVDVLWEAARLGDCFGRLDLTAIKLHVGEPGKTTFVRPVVARALVERLRIVGARPFLTDTCVLYKSPRNNGVGHARVASNHGFSIEQTGAPFLPADGLSGEEEVEMEAGGKHFKTVSIAAGIARARSMLVLSHATGHLATGFGGALKNVGMGCATRKAKLRMHFGRQPDISPDLCDGCGECAAACPEEAIAIDGTAAIDMDRCIGCGACVARCVRDAVAFDWTVSGIELQERIVEHAAAVIRARPKKIVYVTSATSITKDCDCLGSPQEPVCEDIGILASWDPVAIDDAILRMIEERSGKTLESMTYPLHDARAQIRYAVKMGLGRPASKIINVGG
ncbi:MAG: DUF362 domain-containing protein [Candidatus Eisenbacteria bacterium]